MKAVLVLFLSFFSLQVFATHWPTRLSELPFEQRQKIQDDQFSGFSVFDFRFISEQKTVGNHSIVLYGVENALVICETSLVDMDNHYIVLYADGLDIKHVTNFSNFGCHKD